MSPNITLQLRDCLDNNTDIPGDILGAVVKNRISKKDCVDNVSEKLENTVRQLAVLNLRQNYNRDGGIKNRQRVDYVIIYERSLIILELGYDYSIN